MPEAEEKLAAMLTALDATGHDLVGSRALLFDEGATRAAIDDLKSQAPDQILIPQVTFTDAAMAVEIAKTFELPLSIWAVPEPRLGGRLRLNAFCGLNLASHALSLNGVPFSWLYADPDEGVGSALSDLFAGNRTVQPLDPGAIPQATDRGRDIAATLKGQQIARIGMHPDGFDTCAYDPAALDRLAGVGVDEMAIDDLFDRARALPEDAARPLHAKLSQDIAGLEDLDAQQLDRSLRLKLALDTLQQDRASTRKNFLCWTRKRRVACANWHAAVV